MQVAGQCLVERARLFAIAAHAATGQKRKYTNEPYWRHPEEVAQLVSQFGHTPEMLAAAWLHDVVEDTGVDVALIRAEFGEAVADTVAMLTDVSRPEDGNRAARKAIDRAHLAKASPEAMTVKLADLISNSRSIVSRDPEFARVYLREKAALLKVLTGGSCALWLMAKGVLEEGARTLGIDLPELDPAVLVDQAED